MTVIEHNLNFSIPHRGEVYRHYKGDLYVVVGVGCVDIYPSNEFIGTAKVEATQEEVKIYRNLNRSLCIIGMPQNCVDLDSQILVVYARRGQWWVRSLLSFFEETANGQKRFTLMER